MKISSIIRALILTVGLISVTGCVTAVRKAGGQLRPTQVEFSECPHIKGDNYTLVIPPKNNSTSTESPLSHNYRGQFYQSLEKQLKSNGLNVTIVTTTPNDNTEGPIISIQFEKLTHNFIENSWTLNGNINITNNNMKKSYSFDAYTHKTIEHTQSLLDKLSEKMVGCIFSH